ncbi:MAG: alpha/beta hydrolase family protein [Immundisolibacter sp.]
MVAVSLAALADIAMVMDQPHRIEWTPGLSVNAVWSLPSHFSGTALVLAHGAGNDLHQSLLAYLAQALSARGIAVLRFNFPYVDAGRRTPNPASRLLASFSAAVVDARGRFGATLTRLVAGGKSMGAHMAAQLAARGDPIGGLLFLGYPLHASGSTRLRDAYLRAARVPMLFVQGERDSLCQLDLLRPVLAELDAPARLHEVAGGDHSFMLPAEAQHNQTDLYAEIASATEDWLGQI